METIFTRTELLFGEKSTEILKSKRVAIFGVGGVGGYAVEALARSGLGTLDLIDNDTINITNINRQLIATSENIGNLKVEEFKKRIKSINPEIAVNARNVFFLPENATDFDFENYDYVIDAIDTVTGKIGLVTECDKHNVPIISAMGAGNKKDPTQFTVTDIYSTSVCPLARVMRKELKKRGIERLKVVYSTEQPIASENRKSPASCSFVPAVAGMILAGEVIKDLITFG